MYRFNARGGYFTAQSNEEGWWLDGNWAGHNGVQFSSFRKLEDRVIKFLTKSIEELRRYRRTDTIDVNKEINEIERELSNAHKWPYSLFV